MLIEVTSESVAAISAVNAASSKPNLVVKESSAAIALDSSLEIAVALAESPLALATNSAARSVDNTPSAVSALNFSVESAPSNLVTSELVDAISAFKLEITAAKALSFSKSTALMKVTTSANVSLSASAANKIASMSACAESTSVLKPVSIPPALVASLLIAAPSSVTSELVATISADKANSNESIEASASNPNADTSVST